MGQGLRLVTRARCRTVRFPAWCARPGRCSRTGEVAMDRPAHRQLPAHRQPPAHRRYGRRLPTPTRRRDPVPSTQKPRRRVILTHAPLHRPDPPDAYTCVLALQIAHPMRPADNPHQPEPVRTRTAQLASIQETVPIYPSTGRHPQKTATNPPKPATNSRTPSKSSTGKARHGRLESQTPIPPLTRENTLTDHAIQGSQARIVLTSPDRCRPSSGRSSSGHSDERSPPELPATRVAASGRAGGCSTRFAQILANPPSSI